MKQSDLIDALFEETGVGIEIKAMGVLKEAVKELK